MRPDGAQLEKIAALFDAGKLKTLNDKVFPLEDAVTAMKYVESGKAQGKVILKVKK